MRILIWHVHGSWLTALVQGPHTYLVPVLADRGADGRGRAQTWDWPPSVQEVTPEQLRRAEVDLVILQRPRELAGLAERWLGRRPGRDVPAIYLEHNSPEGAVNDMVHPVAARYDIPLVHVTSFNQLMWDSGQAPTRVIEHGIVDPGYRYQGDMARAVAVINDPVPRGRLTGTDIVVDLRRSVPVDLFGMRSEPLDGLDVAQAELHDAMARRRVYLHPNRWTSLGLSLIEAMHLGLPVVAVGSPAVIDAVPAGAGVVSDRLDVLAGAVGRFIDDPDEAVAAGRMARDGALERFNLKRFLDDWDSLAEEVTR